MCRIPFPFKMAMRFAFFLLPMGLVPAAEPEVAMRPGQKVTVPGSEGELVVAALKGWERSYTWKGETRKLVMIPREEEWMGSKGLYYPGPGEHWKEHDGITRAVVEEGIQRFKTLAALKQWFLTERKFMKYHHVAEGTIAGWSTNRQRKQLNCQVWKIRIDDHDLTREEWGEIK
ncbi:hypothetical protein [Luteolibacter sp. Populi]|uniref:hypothetical protein n=1 Tax=Luteolibacter sp. Populi TaxID=3230487 RepID=UPI0034654216